jgi:hypothetical protein
MLLNPPFGTEAYLWLANMVSNFAKMGHGLEIPH